MNISKNFKYFILLIILFFTENVFSNLNHIKVGLKVLPNWEDGIFARSTNGTQVLWQIYESLFILNENLEIISPFFSEWKVKNNNKKYIFKLKNNLKFSDGTLIENKDIINALTRKSNKNKPLIPFIKKIEIKNNYLVATLNKPFNSLPEKLSDIRFSVIKKNTEGNFPIGTGAYSVVYNDHKKIILDKNKFYNNEFGSIKKITFLKLDKIIYNISELDEKKIDFFPLLRIIEDSKKLLKKYIRRKYPSQRINSLVVNIENINIRLMIRKCFNYHTLSSLPYIKDNSVPYNSIIPPGIENYNSKHLNKINNINECKLHIDKIKTVKNIQKEFVLKSPYDTIEDKVFLNNHLKKINLSIKPFKITLQNIPMSEFHNTAKEGKYDLLFIAFSTPYPLAEGILNHFVPKLHDEMAVISFNDEILLSKYEKYLYSNENSKNNHLESIVEHLIYNGFVLPFALRTEIFYIPKSWKNLAFVNGMNGSFFLGKVTDR
jgi:MarR-like DNA-binding transcriptional regulator SgrR of sgrS sRNA